MDPLISSPPHDRHGSCCCFPRHCIGACPRLGCRPRRPPSASSRRCSIGVARPQHPSRIEVIGHSPHAPRPLHLRRIKVVASPHHAAGPCLHLCRIPSVQVSLIGRCSQEYSWVMTSVISVNVFFSYKKQMLRLILPP